VEGFWPIFFLAVVLKIPVFGALWLVWWAVHAEPETEDVGEDDGGHRFHNRGPSKPRGPRRGGPHGGAGARPLPECPPAGRQRVITPPAPLRTPAHASGTRRATPPTPQR
jgi:hypothetical protein